MSAVKNAFLERLELFNAGKPVLSSAISYDYPQLMLGAYKNKMIEVAKKLGEYNDPDFYTDTIQPLENFIASSSLSGAKETYSLKDGANVKVLTFEDGNKLLAMVKFSESVTDPYTGEQGDIAAIKTAYYNDGYHPSKVQIFDDFYPTELVEFLNYAFD